MNEFLIVLFAVFWGWVCSYFAGQRGRNPYGWFFLGFLFGPFPLVALFLLPILKETPPPPTEVPEVHVSHHSPFDQFDWYYLDEERKPVGPISFFELQELGENNKIDDRSFVWNDTMDDWKRVCEVSELKDELAKK